jgi:hypothetical protein
VNPCSFEHAPRGLVRVLAAGTLAFMSSIAVAQVGNPIEGYASVPPSRLDLERCLAPCACALNTLISNASLRFSLTSADITPQGQNFRVVGLRVIATPQGGGVPTTYEGFGNYFIGGPIPFTIQRLQLELFTVSPASVQQPFRFDTGFVPVSILNPFPAIDIEAVSNQVGCSRVTLRFVAVPAPSVCYADMDGSGSLSPADFTAFLNAYRAGSARANCDASPADIGGSFLSPSDFSCFLQQYRNGCQ